MSGQGRFLRSGLVVAVVCLASGIFDGVARTDLASDRALKRVIQGHLKGPFGGDYDTTRFYPAFAQLTNGAHQVVVYVSGPHWCGTGGCTLLVLTSGNGSYQVVSKTIGVQLPVRVLPGETGGWHDLGVRSAEGAKRLAFNGRRYPINAYSFPSQRLTGNHQSEVVIPATAVGLPLYR